MNIRHPCCDRMRYNSNYTLENLMDLSRTESEASTGPGGARVEEGVRIHFLRGASGRTLSREPSLAALQRSSGGNALLAAIAMCERVRLYGVGLYSTSPLGDKRYLHYYDEGVGHCNLGSNSSQEAGDHRYRWKHRRIAKVWRDDRLRHELFLHLMHALGVVQWRQ